MRNYLFFCGFVLTLGLGACAENGDAVASDSPAQQGQDVPMPGTGGAVMGAGGMGGGLDPDGGPGATPDAGVTAGLAGVTTNPGFMNLAPPMGMPFDPAGATPTDAPLPEGWGWYPVEGSVCRDGSQNGVLVRFGSVEKLYIYFEGGGACTTAGFCNYNPANVNQVLSGDGQTVLGSTFGAVAHRQQPGAFEGGVVNGIFDHNNADNPFKDWSMVYVPYCTGDVHFGSNPAAQVPGVAQPQQMMGAENTKKFISRIVPTFRDGIDQVIISGASAGSFGAALNASMIQDSFDGIPVGVILDSGVPFSDTYMPPCIQQAWRDLFKLDNNLPPDCEQCFNQDGGGMLGLADYLVDKHPQSDLAIISSLHDEVIRLFFSPAMDNCATIETADPVGVTLGQAIGAPIFPAADYQAGLEEVRETYEDTGRLATYYIGDPSITLHQHTFRARFYEAAAGGVKMSDFARAFVAGEMQQVAP